MKNFAVILLLLVLMSSSCTIEKMRYSRGYHIEWIGKKNHSVSAQKVKYQKREARTHHAQVPNNNTTVSPEAEEVSIEKTNTVDASKTVNIEKPIPPTLKRKGIITQSKPKENQIISEKTYTESPQKFIQKSAIQKNEKTQLVGIALLLVGLLLALLGLVFFTILGMFFGPIFLVIFLIAATIYIIAGILSLLF